MNNLLEYYNDPKNPGSYSGINTFYKTLKKLNIPVSHNSLKKLLSEQDEYLLHKPLRKKFKRNQILSFGINDTWQADLVDLTKLSRHNNGFKYLLTCIDVFSKKAWVQPLKDKTGISITHAFSKIFQEASPKKIQTDKGKEFLNSNFANLLQKQKVHLYQLNSELKASVVERFNRTIKEKMWRYFTKNNTSKYIDIIQELVSSYNKTYHRSIKMSPLDVSTKNQNKVYENHYGNFNDQVVSFKFQINDRVRVAKYKTLFDKGYTANWSKETFIINKQILRYPPVYELKDLNNEIIEGVFYEYELQKVYKLENVYQIDKILRKREKNGKKEYFVSWKGYPSKFNTWISSEDFV
jgi:hypothetical protein